MMTRSGPVVWGSFERYPNARPSFPQVLELKQLNVNGGGVTVPRNHGVPDKMYGTGLRRVRRFLCVRGSIDRITAINFGPRQGIHLQVHRYFFLQDHARQGIHLRVGNTLNIFGARHT